MATTAISALFGTAAWAGPVLNPSAVIGLTQGKTTTDFTVDPTVGPFAASGGAGTVYQDVTVSSQIKGTKTYTGANNAATYKGDLVIDITGFDGDSLGSGWQLFAVVRVTSSTGTWSVGDTYGDADFTSSSIAGSVQLYAVEGDLATFTDPSSGGVNVGTTTGETNANMSDLGIDNLAGASSGSVCLDKGNAKSDAGTNCILLADGTLTGGSVDISDQTDTELFSLITALTPEAYAVGPGAFFDTTTPGVLDLTIDSGTSTTAAIGISDPKQTYTTDGVGGPVNWQLTAVPEPASLTLFGM
ncbi:MAG: hypothetical protein ACREFO_04460, partial [Acetobacteraceae bacterium]